jgi:hypothetical protein
MAKAKAVVTTTEELERVAVESAADFIADELSKEDRPKLGVTLPPPKKKSKSAEMKEKAAEEERKRKEEREERDRKHKEMEPVRNLAAIATKVLHGGGGYSRKEQREKLEKEAKEAGETAPVYMYSTFCQGADAMDRDNRPCHPLDRAAVRWSLIGAVRKAQTLTYSEWINNPDYSPDKPWDNVNNRPRTEVQLPFPEGTDERLIEELRRVLREKAPAPYNSVPLEVINDSFGVRFAWLLLDWVKNNTSVWNKAVTK